MSDVGAKLAQAGRLGRNAARRVGQRVQQVASQVRDHSGSSADEYAVENDEASAGVVDSKGEGSAQQNRSSVDPAQQLRRVRKSSRTTLAEIKELTAERAQLRQERLDVQQRLGQMHGKSVMPRLKVEKTNGTASFIVGQRMMQRVHRRGLDPRVGLDQVGAVFADEEQTAQFARSHGVPRLTSDGSTASEVRENVRECVVHAFKGQVALVEVRGPEGVRHFNASGEDVGDIRAASRYDATAERPEPFADICTWAGVLSDAIPRPYAQLFFTLADDKVGLERIDVDPDRIPVLTAEWDERLGALFDAAYSRVLLVPYRAGALANRVPGGTFTYEEGA